MCVLRSLSVQIRLVAAIVLFASCVLQAQEPSLQESLRTAEGALQKIQQLVQNQRLFVDDQSQTVEAFERKLSRAKADSELAESELKAQGLEVAELTRVYKADAKDETQRKLNQVKHGYGIAQRAVNNRKKRYRRIEIKFEKSLKSLDVIRTKLSSLNQQEQRQLAYISNLRRKREQELEVQLKRLAAFDANAAAVQNQKEKAQKAEAQLESIAGKAATVSLLVPESKAASVKPVEIDKKEPVVAANLKTLDQEAVKQARRELDRLNRLVAKKTPVRPIYKNLFLSGSKMRRTNFSHLGNNMYRAEAKVKAGKQLLVAATTDLRIRIPYSDDNEVYVFIYDARRASRGRLSMYKKSLLNP